MLVNISMIFIGVFSLQKASSGKISTVLPIWAFFEVGIRSKLFWRIFLWSGLGPKYVLMLSYALLTLTFNFALFLGGFEPFNI